MSGDLEGTKVRTRKKRRAISEEAVRAIRQGGSGQSWINWPNSGERAQKEVGWGACKNPDQKVGSVECVSFKAWSCADGMPTYAKYFKATICDYFLLLSALHIHTIILPNRNRIRQLSLGSPTNWLIGMMIYHSSFYPLLSIIKIFGGGGIN